MNVGHENELENRWYQRIKCINYEVKKVDSFKYLQQTETYMKKLHMNKIFGKITEMEAYWALENVKDGKNVFT
jgi:hypothetical protein